MDWVDILSEETRSPLPNERPRYWSNGLIKHLSLPDKWPVSWEESGLQDKAFTYFLGAFDPPENLQGLSHQLIPLRAILLELAGMTSLASNELDELSSLLDLFIEQTNDYISISKPNERAIFTANKLSDITTLALWRFHFHCSQVVRDVIDKALNLVEVTEATDDLGKVIKVSKLKYLRDGSLDPIYQALAPELHLLLKRKQAAKQNTQVMADILLETETTKSQKHKIYDEALACEHCIHLGHYILKESSGNISLTRRLKNSIRHLSNPKLLHDFAFSLSPKETKVVMKISGHIKSVHNLIASLGRHKKRKKSKRATFKLRSRSHSGRLLPPGQYEDSKEGWESLQPVNIEKPLNIINGIFDDTNTEAILHRRYGLRPKVSDSFGEGDDDYRAEDTITISASWLTDPYRNAIKQQVQIESLITSQEPPIWSAACLKIETIQQYLVNLAAAPHDVSLLASLALHTGLSEQMFQSMRLGEPDIFKMLDASTAIPSDYFEELATEAEANWTGVYLNSNLMKYSYLLPKDSVSYYSEQSPSFVQGCEPSSRVIKIPLPKILQYQIEPYLEGLIGGTIFFPENSDEPNNYLKLFPRWKKTSSGWSELMADTGRMCHENVTPARIRATFRSLYVGQANMAPLHANLIMNEIPNRYRAQHFYANLDGDSLKQEYHEACDLVLENLGYNSEAENQKNISSYLPTYNLGRFGSRLVPTTDALSEYFKILHGQFINDITSPGITPSAWNIMLLFIFRLLQLSTGMRPVRDKFPQWSDISFHIKWIRLSDKDNLKFYESRMLPMATLLLEWLEYFSFMQRKYFLSTNFHLKNIRPPYRDHPTEVVFSYMDMESKIIRPFTFKDMQQTEDEVGLSSAFPFKPNALRHNLFTRLSEHKVDQHIIDFIMGHKHYGSEPFGQFSPISSIQYSKLAIKYLDEFIVSPLDIAAPPPYA